MNCSTERAVSAAFSCWSVASAAWPSRKSWTPWTALLTTSAPATRATMMATYFLKSRPRSAGSRIQRGQARLDNEIGGPLDNRPGKGYPERRARPHVDDELEPRWLLDGK